MSYMKTPKNKKPGRGRWMILLLTLLTFICLVDVLAETRTVRVREFVIASPDVPPAFDGFRIAFISDIHHGPYLSRERVAALVAQVNSIAPDLVLMGGDYIHQGGNYIDSCFDELGKLKASAGVCGVLGNHDHWDGARQAWAAMRKNGIGILDNAGFWLRRGQDKIRIGGVGDLWTDRQVLATAIGAAADKDFVILVSHNPDYAESLHTKKIDLMLSGHTHGGQVTLFGLFAPILPTITGQKYRSGEVDVPDMKVIVSNGTGTITPPVRFFAPAEIVVVRLKKKIE
jgi:predicted MPP superfamily phosphohydrolase